jgi:hypothetical protein
MICVCGLEDADELPFRLRLAAKDARTRLADDLLSEEHDALEDSKAASDGSRDRPPEPLRCVDDPLCLPHDAPCDAQQSLVRILQRFERRFAARRLWPARLRTIYMYRSHNPSRVDRKSHSWTSSDETDRCKKGLSAFPFSTAMQLAAHPRRLSFPVPQKSEKVRWKETRRSATWQRLGGAAEMKKDLLRSRLLDGGGRRRCPLHQHGPREPALPCRVVGACQAITETWKRRKSAARDLSVGVAGELVWGLSLRLLAGAAFG